MTRIRSRVRSRSPVRGLVIGSSGRSPRAIVGCLRSAGRCPRCLAAPARVPCETAPVTITAAVLLGLDLLGTFAFALNGALTAIRSARLDIVGVVTLGVITA
ncbi:MAG: TRIC cation channel family protein, partial [Propionibacteriales bacterium]|nr:TRIC cation channel family protein [Propionibacteriales bacterium]